MSEIRASVLVRVSQDSSKDDRSPDGQRSWARGVCQANGWVYGEEYADTASASEFGEAKGAIRHNFERLIQDISAGRAGQVLIVASVSRSSRDVSVLEDLRKRLVRARMKWYIGKRLMDPEEPADTTVILVEGVLAQTQAMVTHKDVLRGIQEARAAGRAPSGRCPFGFFRPLRAEGAKVVQIPHPINGPLQQWAIIEALPSGASLNEVGRRWAEEGEPRRTRHASTVRKAVLNPAVLGLTVHNGEVLRGTWEPLVTVEQYDRVREILATPERRSLHGGRSTTLLSSIATHARCGHTVNVQRARNPVPMYRCYSCSSGVRIPVAVADARVTAALFEEMYFVAARARARLESRPAVDDVGIATKSLGQARAQYQDLNDHWHDMGFTLEEYAAAVRPLRESVRQAKENLTRAKSGTVPLPRIADPDLYPAVWVQQMTLEQQRRHVKTFLNVSIEGREVFIESKRV